MTFQKFPLLLLMVMDASLALIVVVVIQECQEIHEQALVLRLQRNERHRILKIYIKYFINKC